MLPSLPLKTNQSQQEEGEEREVNEKVTRSRTWLTIPYDPSPSCSPTSKSSKVNFGAAGAVGVVVADVGVAVGDAATAGSGAAILSISLVLCFPSSLLPSYLQRIANQLLAKIIMKKMVKL
jgi:hypothetical protein